MESYEGTIHVAAALIFLWVHSLDPLKLETKCLSQAAVLVVPNISVCGYCKSCPW